MILLTGASGFIGKHLLKSLVEKYGHENVVIFSSQAVNGIHGIQHNNYQFDKDIFITSGFENIHTIVHAGSFTPKNSIEANNIYLSNLNIRNTESLLSAHLPNLKKVVYLSAIDIYKTDSVITEDTQTNPISMYAHSKLYIEKMIENWGKDHNVITQILRIGHIYGPGEESYSKLIPETFKKILSNQPVKVWGKGAELRSFLYIKDVTQVVINVLNYEKNLGVINIAGSQPISTIELVNKIKKIAKSNVDIQMVEPNFEGRNVIFDNSKMLNYLPTKETDLDEGLTEEFVYFQQKMNSDENLL